MRRFIIFLCLLLIAKNVLAGSDDDAKALVNKWNELHNTHEISEFSDIYAPTVLFYGRSYSSQKCVNAKSKLLSVDFKQEIISSIDVKSYSSGTIKCDFTKRTKSRNKTNEHLCYLLIQKQNGKYVITGESDLLSDQKRDIQLQLGSEKMNPGTKNIIIGILSIFSIAAFYTWKKLKQRRKEKASLEELIAYNSNPTQSDKVPLSTSTEENNLALLEKVKEVVREEIKNLTPAETIEKQKGDAFEKFIVTKFDRNIFDLKEWRGDKFHEGIYAKTNHLPDMVWEFLHPNIGTAYFAIECKYRSKYSNDGIELAKIYQLENYDQFENQNQIPVFIILGVGGQAAAPEELFIIPLRDLDSNYISQYDLRRYKKRKTDGTFFYNAHSAELS